MSERSGKINSRSEGQWIEVATKLKMSAAEANRKIGNTRTAVDAFTYRFVRKDFPSHVGEAIRQDFSEAIPPKELANRLGITLHRDKKQESGTSRGVLFGSIGQSPVALSTSVYGARGGFVDDSGRAEVWARAIANEISKVGQVLWPIVKYGNLGQQTYFVEPEVPKEQFLEWGGPESMMAIAQDRKRHPEAIRAFFSCFTQAMQFLKAVETPVKSGVYLLPRDFAKFGGNAIWENSKLRAGEGRLRIRDLGQWQVVSGKTSDREIITRAYQWAAINQFLGTNIGGVFGTDLRFSEAGKGEMASWTDSRFRGKKPYLRSLSKVLGGDANVVGFVEEWNENISPLVQKVSMSPVELRDESLPEVPGYSGLVFTGSPIELIEGVLKNHGLWFPRDVESEKDEKQAGPPSPRLRRVNKRGGIIRGQGRKMATPEKPAEVELTLNEKVFVAMLEDLVGWEKAAGIDGGKLQKEFENMKLQFGRLTIEGYFRAKVTENVTDQLGAEGEKLRKAGKTDEQIFEKWLKRVFISLYKRSEGK